MEHFYLIYNAIFAYQLAIHLQQSISAYIVCVNYTFSILAALYLGFEPLILNPYTK